MTATPSQTKLLVRKGFLALFTTQLLSAFNDNFLKNAVVIWISASQAQLFGLAPEVMISLCSGAFILPFFVLSALAGLLLMAAVAAYNRLSASPPRSGWLDPVRSFTTNAERAALLKIRPSSTN